MPSPLTRRTLPRPRFRRSVTCGIRATRNLVSRWADAGRAVVLREAGKANRGSSPQPRRISEVRRIAGMALGVLLVLWAAWAQGAGENQSGATPAETVSPEQTSPALASQVRALFSFYCSECHGADLVAPKGKFNYVL